MVLVSCVLIDVPKELKILMIFSLLYAFILTQEWDN